MLATSPWPRHEARRAGAAYTARMDATPRGADAHRLFFALWPDAPVRDALHSAVERVAAFRVAGRRVEPGKYHLTLHFLGESADVPASTIDRCRRAAATVACDAFRLVIDRAGSFPPARVEWLAPSGGSGLDALWSAMAEALDEAGVAVRGTDAFRAHVTVLRGLSTSLGELRIEPIRWPVDAFVLVHSHAGHYDVIGRWPLAAR